MQASSVYHCTSYQTIWQHVAWTVWCFTRTPRQILYCQKCSWCISSWHHIWHILAHCNEILLCLPGEKRDSSVLWMSMKYRITRRGRAGIFFHFYFSHWLETGEAKFYIKKVKRSKTYAAKPSTIVLISSGLSCAQCDSGGASASRMSLVGFLLLVLVYYRLQLKAWPCLTGERRTRFLERGKTKPTVQADRSYRCQSSAPKKRQFT